MTTPADIFMHGAGNRFLLHFGSKTPESLCKKYSEVDGILILDEDKDADINMRIINSDGSEAEQCGNGMRCVALHLVRSRYVEGETVRVKTIAGLHTCHVNAEQNEVEVSLQIPRTGPEACMVNMKTCSELPNLVFVNMGNPNAVLWTDKDPIDIRQEWGPKLVGHPAFLEGMNIHIARRDGDNYASCASWERGVGPTHASGTGGASVFVAAHGGSGKFHVSSKGGTLTYRFDGHGAVVMCGPARYE